METNAKAVLELDTLRSCFPQLVSQPATALSSLTLVPRSENCSLEVSLLTILPSGSLGVLLAQPILAFNAVSVAFVPDRICWLFPFLPLKFLFV